MIVYRLLPDGGFVAGDTETRETSYAYPTSTNATAAKRAPAKTAAQMMTNANSFAAFVPGEIGADYNERMWALLDETADALP